MTSLVVDEWCHAIHHVILSMATTTQRRCTNPATPPPLLGGMVSGTCTRATRSGPLSFSLWFTACIYSQSNLVPRYRLIIYCTTHHKILDDWNKSTIADRAMINLALHKLKTRTLNKIKPRTLNKKSTIVASCEKNLVNRAIQSVFVRIQVNWHECIHHWQSSTTSDVCHDDCILAAWPWLQSS